MTDTDFEKLLDEYKAVSALGVSVSWLQKQRCKTDSGTPPVVPFVKIGRKVRYRAEDIRKIRGDVPTENDWGALSNEP